jgi:monothiol glutaredoxin
MDEQIRTQLDQLIKDNRVLLFMKGSRHFPQCGFSATVVQILDQLVPEYQTVNVLKEPDLREGIKEYSSWPTIPQLYVDGKFVGGCDIVREMFVAGELHELFGAKPAEVKPPSITITPMAKKALEAAKETPDAAEDAGVLRLVVSSKFEYELVLDEKKKGDFVVEAGSGVQVLIDRQSAERANGIVIDFVNGPQGGGFRIDNSNEPGGVKSLSPTQAKAMLDKGEAKLLIDVRPDDERARAKIEGAKQLSSEVAAELDALDKSTPIIFHCHHGMRSRSAAERYAAEGFSNVYNLEGGIDAWSLEVDPKVARY